MRIKYQSGSLADHNFNDTLVLCKKKKQHKNPNDLSTKEKLTWLLLAWDTIKAKVFIQQSNAK